MPVRIVATAVISALALSAARAPKTNAITESGGITAQRRLRRRFAGAQESAPGSATSPPCASESSEIDIQNGSTLPPT